MAEGKKSFILYADYKEHFEDLPDDIAGQLIKHIFRYVNDENPVTESLIIKASFNIIKQQLKRDLVRYEATKEQRSISGRAGGIASGQSRSKQTKQMVKKGSKPKQTEANEAVNVNDNVTVNDINIPTLEEFKSYALEKEPLLNLNALNLKYESWKIGGWVNGNGKKIKNWKRSILNTIPYIEKDKKSFAKNR